MKAVVFTDAPRKVQGLRYFAGRGSPDVETRPLKDLKKALPGLEMAPLVYLDVRGLPEKEKARLLGLVSSNPRIRFCILDPTGGIEDVALVFHSGAVDYIGKRMVSKAPATRRRNSPLEYARRIGAVNHAPALLEMPDARTESRDGWADITPGKEHWFAFLCIEVDDADKLKKLHEPENIAGAMATFREFIERTVKHHGGRLWMWSRFGGLALFPLHERTFMAPMCGVRILLSSVFYDHEESLLPGRLSFRMALSVGTTAYREGDTGKIVSDAVNSIFHLGRKFTGPGQFVVTSEAYDLVPPQLRGYFLPAGSYEGRRILRMLRPTPATGVRQAGPAWAG